jgi:hypothetical protein
VLDELRRVLQDERRLTYAIMFGSAARGSLRTDSDVDVAVGLSNGPALTALEIGDLASRLETACGRRVDLVLVDEAPPPLAYRIFRDGEAVLVNDRRALVDRKARAILEYLDFMPVESILTRGALAAAMRGR